MPFPIPLQALRWDAKLEALRSCHSCSGGVWGRMGVKGRGCAPNPGRHGVLGTLVLARPWAGGTYSDSVGCLVSKSPLWTFSGVAFGGGVRTVSEILRSLCSVGPLAPGGNGKLQIHLRDVFFADPPAFCTSGLSSGLNGGAYFPGTWGWLCLLTAAMCFGYMAYPPKSRLWDPETQTHF